MFLPHLVAVLLLLLAGCAPAPQHVRSLTILHTNDLHARFLPDEDGRGGFAQMATAIREERAKSEGALVLHAGDFVQGTPVSTIFEGMPVFEVANRMGFDVNTLGNHEFDYGWKRTLEFIQAAEFPTVSANVVNAEGTLLTPQAYIIQEVNGIRVGVIGALTASLPEISRADRVGPWRALPVAEAIRPYARQLREETDLVVLLCHTFDHEDDEVLQNVSEVPVVVSGHNHGGAQEVKEVDGRICVKVRAYGRELGRLDLEIDVPGKKVVSHRWKRISIDAQTFPADEHVAALVEKWEAKVSEVVDVPIGTSQRRIASKDELQPLIEEIMRDAVGADLAYMNRGGIRDGLPQGQILVRHVWNILPFGNAIRFGRVKGKDLPQEITENRRIDPEKEYILAANEFTAEKWREQGLQLPNEGPLVREAMIDWIKKKRTIE